MGKNCLEMYDSLIENVHSSKFENLCFSGHFILLIRFHSEEIKRQA